MSTGRRTFLGGLLGSLVTALALPGEARPSAPPILLHLVEARARFQHRDQVTPYLAWVDNCVRTAIDRGEREWMTVYHKTGFEAQDEALISLRARGFNAEVRDRMIVVSGWV